MGRRRRGEKEREKECDEKHTGEKGELQLQSRRGRMTTHRHIGFHFHFSRRSIRAPAHPLPVLSPSLSLSLSPSVCSRLMQWMSTVCRSSPMVCSLPTWKVESVSARVYSRWEGWLNAESLSNSPRISECAYTPAPLFTYANEYGSMPLIRILDPAFLRLLFHSFQGYPSIHPSIHLSVRLSRLSVYLIVGPLCALPLGLLLHPSRSDLPPIALDFGLPRFYLNLATVVISHAYDKLIMRCMHRSRTAQRP